ncbi:S1 family peptidase [Myxococcota bacterium]|nr:S1 family peptidase [Myxococcota bacterium]MBU1536370.1 S1 family peptidase [Myxococcota bacterium]
MKSFLPLLLVSLFVFGCETPDDQQYRQDSSAINGGYAEPGEPGVVLIWHQMGYMCTGTLIKPTIVLTAKHCVRDLDSGYDFPIYGFDVRVGPDMWNIEASYGVHEVYTYPGTAIEDEDVALLVLSTAIPENVATPYPIVVSPVGEDALVVESSILSIIGYGESVCGGEGNAGVKLRTEDLFLGYYTSGGDFLTQGRGANHGDSGGPVFTDQMKVVGVTSRGSDEDCVGEYAGITIASSVAHHNSFIADILENEGYCAPTANSDICDDGEDNDCNGYIDDGCLLPGELCTDNWQCGNGLCYDQGGESRCIKTCNAYIVSGTCGSGHYCQPQGCGEEGICSAGDRGAKGYFESCNQDTDCESLFCSQAGDGVSRCLYPCLPGSDHCLMDEMCVTSSQGCGACVPSSYGPAAGRNLGELCTSGDQCVSGYCFDAGEVGYCSTACSQQAPCTDGFHCADGSCTKGNVGVIGDPCSVSSDCGGGLFCADFGEGSGHCSTDCSGGVGCADQGFFCATAVNGQFCKSASGLQVGDECGSGSCSTGLFCVEAAEGDYRCASICHRYESDRCPASTGCYETTRTYCLPFDAAPKTTGTGDGGDSGGLFGCATPSGKSPAPLSLPLLAMFMLSLMILRKSI